MLTGNKGEWSEPYVLFRLLGDGEVSIANSDLSIQAGMNFKVDRVVRLESGVNICFQSTEVGVAVQLDGKELLLDRDTFRLTADDLFLEMCRSKGTFGHERSEKLLSACGIHQLKASSSQKGDIELRVVEPRLGILQTINFSVKSEVGSAATLLNASKATNFRFVAKRFVGEVSTLPTKDSDRRFLLKFVREIREKSDSIDLVGPRSETFRNNLRMVDDSMDLVVGNLLLTHYEFPQMDISELCDVLVQRNPLDIDEEVAPYFYRHKVKCLLADIGLGFTPARSWDGDYEANGGYLVVRTDGNLACIHAFDRNTFRDYLFRSTILERADTKRHKYGSIVDVLPRDDEFVDLTFDLNLQIRFK